MEKIKDYKVIDRLINIASIKAKKAECIIFLSSHYLVPITLVNFHNRIADGKKLALKCVLDVTKADVISTTRKKWRTMKLKSFNKEINLRLFPQKSPADFI